MPKTKKKEEGLKCPNCGKKDPDDPKIKNVAGGNFVLVRSGTREEFPDATITKKGHLRVTTSTEQGEARYYLACIACGHEWDWYGEIDFE